MKIVFDPAKRDKTLRERPLDFERVDAVFAGLTQAMDDDRFD